MLATLILLQVMWQPLGLPTVETMVATLRHAFALYGYWALLGAAFLEGMFLLSIYLPGSLVIASAILLSGGTWQELLIISCLSWLAFMLAAIINYAIGYFGLYRFFNWLGAKHVIKETQGWISRYGQWVFMLASVHPNYLSVVEVCAGIARHGLVKTLILAGTGMAITVPALVFIGSLVIHTLVNNGGMAGLFLIFMALFGLWAVAIIAHGIYNDFHHQPIKP